MKKSICVILALTLLIGGVIIMSGCEESSDNYASDDTEKNNYSSSNKDYASNKNYGSSCGHASCKTNGPFYCIGKNDTCPNKTGCAYDFYCDQCD